MGSGAGSAAKYRASNETPDVKCKAPAQPTVEQSIQAAKDASTSPPPSASSSKSGEGGPRIVRDDSQVGGFRKGNSGEFRAKLRMVEGAGDATIMPAPTAVAASTMAPGGLQGIRPLSEGKALPGSISRRSWPASPAGLPPGMAPLRPPSPPALRKISAAPEVYAESSVVARMAGQPRN